MNRPFNFTAWADFQDQPVGMPGKIFDRMDNDGRSAVPVGGPAPYGRVLVRGPNSLGTDPQGIGATHALTDRYFTNVDDCCLPDVNGEHLINCETGNTFAADSIALPTDADGDLIVMGIGMWTEHGLSGLSPRLTQPFGLGDCQYQAERCGQIGMATEGNVWAYCETDINVGDALFFRTVVPAGNLTDGLSLLGAFTTVDDGETQPFPFGSVFRPGPAGGAFVVNLNIQK